ncbi:hypothetical protein DEU56DRAFT_39855 [Suillus clintonianus]|uniref:uncharacterized protein n=1 Tax=Suillus clintonianus TaxID=1904413 RepID=UPI001B862009|nr:uncharacterized protein DEU56DRAFT_39855 [Suillus clintonianus]KAG2124200.1 hypothetical protein DEU56DRAFT_39855 [Suillus clintonianus]
MASTELATERALYIVNTIGYVIYGGILFLYAYSTYRTMASRRPMPRRLFYISFGGLLVILLTVSGPTNAVFCESMWIDPVTDSAANILIDGLTLYRCSIIWGSRLQIILLFFIFFFLFIVR